MAMMPAHLPGSMVPISFDQPSKSASSIEVVWIACNGGNGFLHVLLRIRHRPSLTRLHIQQGARR